VAIEEPDRVAAVFVAEDATVAIGDVLAAVLISCEDDPSKLVEVAIRDDTPRHPAPGSAGRRA
jgi:hypothetical protein